MSFYRFAKVIVQSFWKPLYRLEVRGIEHFPKEGGVLLCSNHKSNFDPVFLGVASPRPLHFMAKAELFENRALKKLITSLYAFPVRRGFGDREALRTALNVLKEGNVFAIFPEGTRNRTGKLGKGLSGAGFFALRSDVQVVPCAIIGPYKIFRKHKVIFGKPIDFSSARENKISAKEATEIIMKEIQSLIDQHEDY